MASDTTPGDEMTRIDDATRQAEQRDANMPADAGPAPTPDEERAAEQNTVDPEVARNNKEATERGAALQGEGRIEG